MAPMFCATEMDLVIPFEILRAHYSQQIGRAFLRGFGPMPEEPRLQAYLQVECKR